MSSGRLGSLGAHRQSRTARSILSAVSAATRTIPAGLQCAALKQRVVGNPSDLLCSFDPLADFGTLGTAGRENGGAPRVPPDRNGTSNRSCASCDAFIETGDGTPQPADSHTHGGRSDLRSARVVSAAVTLVSHSAPQGLRAFCGTPWVTRHRARSAW